MDLTLIGNTFDGSKWGAVLNNILGPFTLSTTNSFVGSGNPLSISGVNLTVDGLALGFATVEGGIGINVGKRDRQFAGDLPSTGITISNTTVTGFGTGINAILLTNTPNNLTLDNVTACGNNRGIGIRANGAQVLGGNVTGNSIDGVHVFTLSTNVVIDGVNFFGNFNGLDVVDETAAATVLNSTNDPFNCPVPGGANDTTPPLLTIPADVTEEATGEFTPVAIGTATATDDADPNPAVINDAPATFPLGDTDVEWTATDASGNSTSAIQVVTVEDTTPPAFTVPAAITLECNASGGVSHSDSAVQAFLNGASATDLVDGPGLSVTNDASGTCALGLTTVTFTATDAAGNEGTAQSTITVQDTTGPTPSAALVPVPGEVEEDEGEFEAVFSCSDSCSSSQSVGVMVTPSLAGLEVELKIDPETKVEFDFEDGTVEIKGPDPQALLVQLQNLGGLVITSGQLLELEIDDDGDDVEFKFKDDGTLEIEGPAGSHILKVICTDASGNSATATVTPTFAPEEEEEEDEDED